MTLDEGADPLELVPRAEPARFDSGELAGPDGAALLASSRCSSRSAGRRSSTARRARRATAGGARRQGRADPRRGLEPGRLRRRQRRSPSVARALESAGVIVRAIPGRTWLTSLAGRLELRGRPRAASSLLSESSAACDCRICRTYDAVMSGREIGPSSTTSMCASGSRRRVGSTIAIGNQGLVPCSSSHSRSPSATRQIPGVVLDPDRMRSDRDVLRAVVDRRLHPIAQLVVAHLRIAVREQSAQGPTVVGRHHARHRLDDGIGSGQASVPCAASRPTGLPPESAPPPPGRDARRRPAPPGSCRRPSGSAAPARPTPRSAQSDPACRSAGRMGPAGTTRQRRARRT